jgi:hypothetical protein
LGTSSEAHFPFELRNGGIRFRIDQYIDDGSDRRFQRAVQRALKISRLLDAYPYAAAGARGGASKI